MSWLRRRRKRTHAGNVSTWVPGAGDRVWKRPARPETAARTGARDERPRDERPGANDAARTHAGTGSAAIAAGTASRGGTATAPARNAHETMHRRRRPRARALVAVGVALLGITGGLATPSFLAPLLTRARNEWLSLRAIAVSGASDRVPSDEIASATGLALGTSLLDVDPAAAEARVLAHPWVAGARVVRLPPSTLVVSVKLRNPVARVAREPDGDEWLVDDAGRSFAPASADDAARLPLLVTGIVDAPAGAAAVALAEGAVAAQALLHSTVMRPAQILVAAPGDPDGLRVRLGGLPAEVVLGTGQLDRKFAHLARLLSAEIPGIGAASAIDLRFADQAVLRGLPSPEASAQRAVKPGEGEPPSDRRG